MSKEFQCMHVESKKIIPLCTGSALKELMQAIFPMELCEDSAYPACEGFCYPSIPQAECLPLFDGTCKCIGKCILSILCS